MTTVPLRPALAATLALALLPALPAAAGTTTYAVAGSWTWSADFLDPSTSPVDPRFTLSDLDGDGTFTLTTSELPAGPFLAVPYADGAIAPGADTTPSAADAHVASPGVPVTFSYTPATGEFVVESDTPAGQFDPATDSAFWVDADTLAFPADMPATGDGAPRPLGEDFVTVRFSGMDPFAWTWRQGWGFDLPFVTGTPSFTFRESAFTADQLRSAPYLAEYVALDAVSATNASLTDLGRYREPGFDAVAIRWERPNVKLATVGVARSATEAVGVPGGAVAPEEPAALEGRGVRLDGVGAVGVRVPEGAEVLTGDWDGDGVETLGWREGKSFVFAQDHAGTSTVSMLYGRVDDEVLVGDFDGDGVDTVAVRRGRDLHVNDSFTAGPASRVVTYGRADDEMWVADIDGDGVDTPLVRRGNTFHVKNSFASGPADLRVSFGRPDETLLTGDVDGNGRDDLVIHRGADFFVNTTLSSGVASLTIPFGTAGDTGVLGDWDGGGRARPGVVSD